VLVLLLVAFGLVTIERGSTASGTTAPKDPSPERVKDTRALLYAVDQLELCYFQRHKRFSANPAELTKFSRDSSKDVIDGTNPLVLASGHAFRLDLYASNDGQAYTQRILGDKIDSVFERDEDNDFADYGLYAWRHVKDTCQS
jgi:hypothetical protein